MRVDRGIKNRGMVVTRGVSCPAVLVECGFLSHPGERKKLLDDNYRETMSAGIADGILAYLRLVEEAPLAGLSFPDRAGRGGGAGWAGGESAGQSGVVGPEQFGRRPRYPAAEFVVQGHVGPVAAPADEFDLAACG